MKKGDSSKAVGRCYEKRARDFLETQGYQILEENYRCKKGEIDLIARDGEYLCFIEVKFRSGEAFGGPLVAVDRKKQRKIWDTALFYLVKKGYGERVSCRFDVVGITPDSIQLIKNAFER